MTPLRLEIFLTNFNPAETLENDNDSPHFALARWQLLTVLDDFAQSSDPRLQIFLLKKYRMSCMSVFSCVSLLVMC